jgi:membrane associated rhomboid family serine protease
MFEPPLDVRIPAPSQAKAMDWSLVLASQGIPHFIAPPDESGQWGLMLAGADGERAEQAVRLYEAENAPRPWQQPVLAGRVMFDWAAVVWAIPLIAIHFLELRAPELREPALMHGTAVSRGEWWRLVTATQLHADGGHLASNLTIGFLLVGLVLGRWGTATGLAAVLLAGVGGNTLNWLLQPEARSLGASGAVMGCLGLLAVTPRGAFGGPHRAWRGVAGSLAAAVMLFVLLGLDPRSDVVAHGGGFLTGLLLAAALRYRPTRRNPWGEGLALALFTALQLAAWRAVLRSVG